MKYMGSKNRISKHILPIILKERKLGQWYVEPFVGGGNLIDKVQGNRIGSDINPYVISALISIRDHLIDLPKNNTEFTEKDYNNLRSNESYLHTGYAGFAFSYGGKWMGGWGRDSKGERDYVAESYRNALKQAPKLKDVVLVNKSYLQLEIPKSSIIYCDPPYFGTTNYKTNFNHNEFWEWCKLKGNEGHRIFVSEYSAPRDFTELWQGKLTSSLTKNTGSKYGVERLFTYTPTIND